VNSKASKVKKRRKQVPHPLQSIAALWRLLGELAKASTELNTFFGARAIRQQE
jgi:hypothetical protein